MNNKSYTLQTIANELKISSSLIRFWCDEFDIKPIVQNKKGDMRFSENDYQRILEIYQLIEKENYTLEDSKKILVLNEEKRKENEKSIQKLKEIKQFFILLKEQLD